MSIANRITLLRVLFTVIFMIFHSFLSPNDKSFYEILKRFFKKMKSYKSSFGLKNIS
jgi:hypothetical protein